MNKRNEWTNREIIDILESQKVAVPHDGEQLGWDYIVNNNIDGLIEIFERFDVPENVPGAYIYDTNSKEVFTADAIDFEDDDDIPF